MPKSKIGAKIWSFFDDVKLFLQEVKARWNADTPKFFRVLSRTCLWIAGLGGVPTILSKFGIIFPPDWLETFMQIITGAGALGAFIAQMPFGKGQHVNLEYTEKKQEEKLEKENG